MKRHSAIAYAAVLAAVLIFAVGCSKKPDDAKMSSDIQSKFAQDSGLASKQLTVQANDGVVTVSGNVENTSQRDVAGRLAASEPGVKTVINNLQVGNADAAPAAQPEPQAENSPAEKPEPAITTIPKKERPRHEHSRDSHRADSDSGQQQTAVNAPPPDGSMAPPPPSNVTVIPPTPPPPKKFVIDQGTQLSVRLVDAIDSEKNQTGDTFHATLNTPLTSDGEQAVPAGVEVTGHLVDVKSAGKFKGQSQVVLQIDSLTSGGKTYNLQTDQYTKTGSSRGKNTAEKVGAGAVVGTLIGALAGGGKGAAVGAAAGAGVGGGVQAATKGQQIKLPSETVLNFTLQAPITVVQARSSDADRQKLSNSQ